MAVVGQEKSRIIWVLAWIALKMFGNGIHKVLKFFNKPNVYLGMVENNFKGLWKGGYTYGAMLAWQMVFVLFMSAQLCLCSFKKPVWVELRREGVQTPSSGKLLSMLRQKLFQASLDRQKIHGIKMMAWSSCKDPAGMGRVQPGKSHKRWRDLPRDKRRTEFAQWLRKSLSWLEANNCLQGHKEHGIAVYKTLWCSSVLPSCFKKYLIKNLHY